MTRIPPGLPYHWLHTVNTDDMDSPWTPLPLTAHGENWWQGFLLHSPIIDCTQWTLMTRIPPRLPYHWLLTVNTDDKDSSRTPLPLTAHGEHWWQGFLLHSPIIDCPRWTLMTRIPPGLPYPWLSTVNTDDKDSSRTPLSLTAHGEHWWQGFLLDSPIPDCPRWTLMARIPPRLPYHWLPTVNTDYKDSSPITDCPRWTLMTRIPPGLPYHWLPTVNTDGKDSS